MPPKAALVVAAKKSVDTESSSDDEEEREIKQEDVKHVWTKECQQFVVFAKDKGTMAVIDVNGTDTDLFTLEAVTSVNLNILIQVWGLHAKIVQDYIR
jgi:hypothetical protein